MKLGLQSFLFLLFIGIQLPLLAQKIDSVFLFAFSQSREGLRFVWSEDEMMWNDVGEGYVYLRSDYGRWGSEKKMNQPYLFRGEDHLWHCVWALNEYDSAFGHAASEDLIHWKRQSYPFVKSPDFHEPVIGFNSGTKKYSICWRCIEEHQFYQCETSDFRAYTSAQLIDSALYENGRRELRLSWGSVKGTLHRVPRILVEKLMAYAEQRKVLAGLWDERTEGDAVRFAGLKPLNVQLTIDASETKPISDKLIGVFFEDINYGADGGLYGELVQNRDFEYALSDKEGWDKSWNSYHSWSLKGGNMSFVIDTLKPIHPNNPHYAVLEVVESGSALVNHGYDGIALKAGEKYAFSVFAQRLAGKCKELMIRLVTPDGRICAEGRIRIPHSGWKKSELVLQAKEDISNASLEILPLGKGKIALDMISLFPQHTFKNRPNGLRVDLAQAIAGLHPRFMRFPGGCVSHGDGLANIYRWKNTIGPLEARKPQRNLWGYHQSMGLGYYEYFQFCEDIGAEPLPVIAAGVPCQNSGVGGSGQQGGIPMCEMQTYVQDILDLVEYANGDVSTPWGKRRAEAGHPEPFHLKYIGIGNEDLITDVFEERFTMIFEALKQKHPEITVIGTVGPFCEGTDYEEGWGLARRLGVPMVDEHYYQSPGWFIYNADFYDQYDRKGPKVYLGEYAAHLPGRPNNLETALAEALYLTGVERNGDVVHMTSYAPLLAKEGHTQWNPDLIYFNNTTIKPTTGYYVQQLFGQYCGTEYVSNQMVVPVTEEKVKNRLAVSVVKDSCENYIIKMVNLLPVEVQLNVSLENLPVMQSENTTVSGKLMTGKPTDCQLTPESFEMNLSGKELDRSLSPYSLTVIKINTGLTTQSQN